MIDSNLFLAVFVGIFSLLVLILYFRIQAFISLLISSIIVGVAAGMPPTEIIVTIQKGMGDTLGFVAVVVGLGAIFGAILEHSGGASSLAQYLIDHFGEKRASWAMMITGFFIAIPVFFDVGFIILIPMVYSLQRKTKKSLLLYAMPLLAGLAITHAFIPPTPGPVAVADILKADIGWVILFGVIVGIPTAIVSGPLFSSFISTRIHINAPQEESKIVIKNNLPKISILLAIVGLPILLIVFNTLLNSIPFKDGSFISRLQSVFTLIGHPFSALIIANMIAWYVLGIRQGFTKDQLHDISSKSIAPAGIIILLTGAGGVLKQMLIETGAGEMLARHFADAGIGIFVFAFISASIVRILQGSATVAMITAAGLTAPLISTDLGEIPKAMLVINIAAGASILSHVNDSGFWLVSKYLGLSEKQTFQSWSVMTSIIALSGFAIIMLLNLFIRF